MKVLLLFAVFFCLVQRNSGDIPPGIRNTVCFMQRGHCRLFMCLTSPTHSERVEQKPSSALNAVFKGMAGSLALCPLKLSASFSSLLPFLSLLTL
ncbi:sperm associated antigen 11, isoform CRA_b [Rattus norvegicus]|uniref:Sperm associated antigen 11, isoform CRA_b n=1 Tax=Rattus norvegicus TaxID=10116 RepID=A6IWA5_RAT|nr:sperm associated antigen 11, isoform CRA_b [Rattus norvegicus]